MPTNLDEIRRLLDECTEEERLAIFNDLRNQFKIHPIEEELNVRAEIILEAIHRASDVSIRGVRGLISEASFEYYVVANLVGWRAETILGDTPYDFLLSDSAGSVSIQVKMQRLERHQPKLAKKIWQQEGKTVYVVETQKTRSGANEAGESTRPYRFGEFDVIAVSMHPSSRDWSLFFYTVGRWLLPSGNDGALIGTFQPVPSEPDENTWTTDFTKAVQWFRDGEQKRIWAPPEVKSAVRTEQVASGGGGPVP